ncbi:substrate-binding domain-containing protein [Niabella sp. W65]|nr:substrate-binding domain-containing protein [Niabella sp. W65]MCH7364504.1 substrate-binding domain-containing protein [Niabella sp. W65]ULT40364.1 substrate-binding domain-containing protein [Niabella sp. I65]
MLKSIPSGKLTILDKRVAGLDHPAEICQDFENDIFDALMSQHRLLEKYNNLVVILREDEFHPREIIKGIKRFCRKHQKNFKVAAGAEELTLRPATLYIETSESDLAHLIKKAKELGLKLGKDIGIISFNETVLKDLLQVTVVTTDFDKMGEAAATCLLKNDRQKIKVPFNFVKKNSLVCSGQCCIRQALPLLKKWCIFRLNFLAWPGARHGAVGVNHLHVHE